jgi:hypothetical protein
MTTLFQINPVPVLFKSETKNIRSPYKTKTSCVCFPNPNGLFYMGYGINHFRENNTRVTVLIIPTSNETFTICKYDLFHNCLQIYNLSSVENQQYSIDGFSPGRNIKIQGTCQIKQLL